MKALSLLLLFTLACSFCFSQGSSIDRFKAELSIATHDTSRVILMANICNSFSGSNPDSALYYGEKALALARKIEFTRGEILTLSYMSGVFTNTGNLPKGLSIALEALQIAEKSQQYLNKKFPFIYISVVYRELNDLPKSITFRKKAMNIAESEKNTTSMSIEYGSVGNLYVLSGQLDSASFYLQKSLILSKDKQALTGTYRGLGDIQSRKGNFIPAMSFYRKSLSIASLNVSHRNIALAYLGIAGLYKNMNQLDSAIYYAKKALAKASLVSQKRTTVDVSTLLSELYEPIDTKESYRYYKLSTTTKEGLFGAGNIQAIQAMIAQEEERQKEIEKAKLAYNSQLRQYALLAILVILLLVAFFLYRNNQKEKKAKNLLHRQKEEINLQRDKAEKALTELKSTQAQLIQKEKLASLGELTAGIAHEIQNPLNFVNNFSELSVELIEELGPPTPDGGAPEAPFGGWGAFLDDITQNLQKINHHGKRASSIVKGMLEHSKASTGERELTDINQLADEYLRLSYHGLRAKDNSFNSGYELITDEHLPKTEVVPQELGRVLLNLINNAFYAVNERAKQGETNYQPKVTVTTKATDNQVLIHVKDNGTGIPDPIKAKIFQPFFTTKPTGEGTGLGLSLAYDIVTKGHGGTLEVESVEGEGTTFIVKLQFT